MLHQFQLEKGLFSFRIKSKQIKVSSCKMIKSRVFYPLHLFHWYLIGSFSDCLIFWAGIGNFKPRLTLFPSIICIHFYCIFIPYDSFSESQVSPQLTNWLQHFFTSRCHFSYHGLRTPNEGINQRNLKIWADVADKICFGHT